MSARHLVRIDRKSVDFDVKLSYQRFNLDLRYPFTISRESKTVQPTLIVQVAARGKFGYGEASANSYYSATIDSIIAAVESAKPLIENDSFENPDALVASLTDLLSDNRFALAAIDSAIYDLWGKLVGMPLHRFWGGSTETLPMSDYTLGIDTLDMMLVKMRAMDGWPIYKVKLGVANDLEIVRTLRRHTNALFRVDANCGWGVDQVLEWSPELSQLGVEFLEQPLPPTDIDGQRRAFEQSMLPLIADESCITEDDVEGCVGLFHGINIKLMKCGGLAAARRMIAKARSLNLKVMLGCMTESTVGISALAQLLPLVDYVDMDGALLLARDIASGIRLDRGRCIYSPLNGTGVWLLNGCL